MDAFGTAHSGQRNEKRTHDGGCITGPSLARKRSLCKQRSSAGMTNIARQLANAGYDPTLIAVEFKQMVDGNMRGQSYHGGFFHKTSNLSASQNARLWQTGPVLLKQLSKLFVISTVSIPQPLAMVALMTVRTICSFGALKDKVEDGAALLGRLLKLGLGLKRGLRLKR